MKKITKLIFLIMILSLIKISYCHKNYNHKNNDKDDNYEIETIIILKEPASTITNTKLTTTTDTTTITTPTTTTSTTTTTTTPIIDNCFEDNGLGFIKHQDGNAMTYDDCINKFGNCPAGTTFYGLQYRVIQGSSNYYTCFCYNDENKPTVKSGECSKFENNADNKLYYYGEDKRYVYVFSDPPPPAITTPV